MTKPAIGWRATEPAPQAPETPLVLSWPPTVWDLGASLVHASCVRCGAPQADVRNVRPELATDRQQHEDYLASCCDGCWVLIEKFAEEEPTDIFTAFWTAPRHQPEQVVPRPAGLAWSPAVARRIEAWRATRPEAQSLRPWPNRQVLIQLPTSHRSTKE